MTEHLLKIALSELTTARITCGHCGVIVETPVSKLTDVFAESKCGYCGEPFRRQAGVNVLEGLQRAIEKALAVEKQTTIEFVIPVK